MQVTNRFCLSFAAALFAGSVAAAGDVATTDLHAAHKKMMAAPTTRIEQTEYDIPDINLVDSSGANVNLHSLFSDGEAVVVNFIFTTCTTICPVITATTLQLQKELLAEAEQPKYVSISIDPNYDSAQILREYANNYGADWTFLTGSSKNIVTALQAFDAYRGNKVNHFALLLMRPANATQWTRVEGLTSVEKLAQIWRESAL